MKLAFVLLFCTVPAMAQTSSIPAACGNIGVDYKMNLDKSEHGITAPEAGKARVYIIHDPGSIPLINYPVVAVALDGTSVGANRDNSYFTFNVDPGEHHLCSSYGGAKEYFELAHFTAVAGKTYYFRTRVIYTDHKFMLDLSPVDSDLGEYRVKVTPLSVSTRVH